MKTLIIILLSAIFALSATGQGTTICSNEENQNGFFIRKCVILPENTFGGGENSVKSGVPFQYLIWFTLPENATNVVIEDIVPSELEILNTIPAATINTATNTVSYEVPEGTTGNTAQSLAVNVKFYPGITCNGTLVFNVAQIEADQLSQPLVTDSLAVEAYAVNPFAFDKQSTLPKDPVTKIYGGVVGQPVTYLLKIHKPSGYYYSDIGQQNLDYIYIYDIIPAEAVLVEPVVCNDQIVDASLENGSIKLDCSSFTLLGAQMTPQLLCKLQINYPEEHFPLDTIIENEAYYTGKSCGEIDSVPSNKIQVHLGEAAPGGSANKIVKVINPVSGCVGNYWLYVYNNGNVPLDNYIIEDLFPEEVEIQLIEMFRSNIDADVPLTLTIGQDQIEFGSLPNRTILYSIQQGVPILPGTSINILRGNTDKPIPLDSYCRYRIEFLISDNPILPTGYEVANEATFTFTYNQEPIDIITSEVSFEIEDFQPKVCLYKNVCNPQNSYMYGDIVRYRFTMQNNGSANLDGAIIEDLLNSSLEYLGNESYYSSNLVNPDCGTGVELPPGTSLWAGLETEHSQNNLKWTGIEIDPYCEQTNIWLGNGCDPPGITYYFIEFDTKVKQNAPAGSISNFFTMSEGGLLSMAESTEANIVINNVFGANAEKFISKDNGTSWHKTLDVNQNDELMFRLQFTNNSNYPVTEIVLMDLLPMNYNPAEDKMILDRSSNRGSQFGLEYFNSNLPGISTNPPAGFNLPVVSVDNENNICTPELLYNPGLCNTPSWLNSQGKNVKFDFGSDNILPPGGQLKCDFKVDIPENTSSGLMACNSFAVRSKGILTLGNETVIIDNIASESDVACLNYSFEPANEVLCENPVFLWIEHAGGSKNYIDYAWGNAIVTDANKNIYTTGAYEGTVVFPNGEVLSSGTAESKIFVAKQNETGDFLWITDLGEVGVNEGRAIAISTSGDIYITGIKTFVEYYSQELVAEAFVAKLDGEEGTLLATTATDFSYWPSAGNDIVLDADDNVFITGYECMWLKSDEPQKSSSYCGWDDVLLKRFDKDLNMIVTPETGCFGGNGVDAGNGIALDLNGNIYISGFFEQTVNFNPDWFGTHVYKTSVGGRDIFILKLSPDMEFLWVATMGGEGDDCGSDIAADESGDIYITGFVSLSSFPVTGFDINHNPVGISDGFVSKWSPSGTCLWTKFSETENPDDFSKGYSIEIGPDQEKVFSTGLFGGTVNFNLDYPAPVTASYQDMFLLKLETNTGNYISNMLNEGLADNCIDPGQHSIAVDNNGCLYTTGRFIETDFDPMNGYNLSATGMCDVFVQKLCCCCPGEEDFFARLAQGFKVEIDNENCKVTVSLHQFNACHWIANDGPSWGDGSIIQPVLTPANREWSHYYNQSGEFEICTTVYELSEDGDVCYFGQVCTVVELWCLPFLCKDTTICCLDLPILLSGEAPEGSIFSGDFVTEEDGEFYFNPNCDDFPAPVPPGYPGYRKFHEITYTYSDPSGNPYSCNFTITVDSDEPPGQYCTALDTVLCISSAPFWHGFVYIDPAELGIDTHYLNCTFSNACGGWSWATIPESARIKVTVVENAASFIIPDIAVCEGDDDFVYFGTMINVGDLYIGNNTKSAEVEICGVIVTVNFNVHVTEWEWCVHPEPWPIPYPWDVISLWYQPYPPAIWPIFEPEIYNNHLEVVLSMNGIFWPSGGINTIGNWDVYQGYKIKMNEPGWIEVIGEIPEDKTINLNPGANYIPVLSAEYYPAMDIFAQLGSGLIFAYDLSSELLFWPDGGIYMLDVLEPGKGYIVGMTQPGQATYDPLLKTDFKDYVPVKPKVYANAPWKVAKSGSPHLISIDRSAVAEFEPGDFIGVFNAEGMCSGMSQIDKSESNLLLVAYGNDFTEKTATGLAVGEAMQFKVYHASTMDETHADVTFDASMPNTGLFAENGLSKITKIKTGATSVGENVLSNIQIYPNPSDGTFTIEGVNSKVNIKIVNIFGEQIYFGELELPSKLDLSTQPKGIYFISIEMDNKTNYKKLIIN